MTRRSGEILVSAHGKGAPALMRAERPPLDEQEPPNANDTEQGLAEAKRRGRPFEPGNAAAENRKPMLCRLAVPLDACDPRVRAALKRADRLHRRRVRELTIMCGGTLSAGPCAMLASSARALASSTVVYALAADALTAGRTKDAADLFATSARLADSARQQELTALALAEREAAARVRTTTPVEAQREIARRILGEK